MFTGIGERLPLRVAHREARPGTRAAVGRAAVALAPPRAERGSRTACSCSGSAATTGSKQMLVVRMRRQLRAAELASLSGCALADEIAKPRRAESSCVMPPAPAPRPGAHRHPRAAAAVQDALSEPMPAPARRMSNRAAQPSQTSAAPSSVARSMPLAQAGQVGDIRVENVAGSRDEHAGAVDRRPHDRAVLEVAGRERPASPTRPTAPAAARAAARGADASIGSATSPVIGGGPLRSRVHGIGDLDRRRRPAPPRRSPSPRRASA